MSRKLYKPDGLGKQFAKLDLDRVGYFHDPPLGPFDAYSSVPVKFRENGEKGRQMFTGPPTNLFQEKFIRIFSGEALTEPWRIEAHERLLQEKAKVAGRLIPPSPAKKQSTPGDWHGCFEKIAYFSPALRVTKRTKAKILAPNMKIKPNPRGGPGFVDICLNPYPPYSSNPYDPPKAREIAWKKRGKHFLTSSAPAEFFQTNPYKEAEPGPTYVRPVQMPSKMIGPGRLYVPFPKKPGGNHSGCFAKFPSYSSNPYEADKEAKKVEGVFVRGGPPRRSKYTNSIVSQVTRIACNSKNYTHYQEQVYPLKK